MSAPPTILPTLDREPDFISVCVLRIGAPYEHLGQAVAEVVVLRILTGQRGWAVIPHVALENARAAICAGWTVHMQFSHVRWEQ